METDVITKLTPEKEARDPETAGERLSALAQVTGLAPLVAANPNTPPDTLLNLLYRFPRHVIENPIVPLLLIENPQFFKHHERPLLPFVLAADVPDFVLSIMRVSKDALARDAARYHVQCGGESGSDWEIHARAAIRRRPYHIDTARRPRMDEREIARLFCQVPDVPDWLLTALASHRVDAVRLAVATYPGAADPPEMRRSHTASDSRLPSHVVARLARDSSPVVRAKAARRGDLAEADISQLADDSESSVRAAVAANPHVPAAVLKRLETYDYSLASNPQTPPEVLERITCGNDYMVMAALAANPGVTRQLFALIGSGDRGNVVIKDESICFQICRHPYATDEVRRRVFAAMLRGLAPYGAWLRRVTILSSSLVPASVLVEEAKSTDWLDRYAIARNPSADEKTVRILAERDGNRFVRAAARARVASPPTPLPCGGEGGPTAA